MDENFALRRTTSIRWKPGVLEPACCGRAAGDGDDDGAADADEVGDELRAGCRAPHLPPTTTTHPRRETMLAKGQVCTNPGW